MQKFIELLMREPLLAVIVIGWIFGILGRLLTRAGKARAAAAKRAPPSAQPRHASGPVAHQTMRQTMRQTMGQRVGPSLRPMPQPMAAPLRPRAHPTPEEVAQEMRRIFGMEPEGSSPRAPAEPLPPRPVRREPESPERAPEPMRPSKLGQLGVHVDPHVGAGIQQRRAPMSGSVGAQQLGMLGGRTRTVSRTLRRGGSPLVDLSNLPRAIVLREIFDRPLGLRDLDGR